MAQALPDAALRARAGAYVHGDERYTLGVKAGKLLLQYRTTGKWTPMSALSPTDVHRALRVRAAHNRHSTEAEVRAILAMVVKPESRISMGDALAAIGRNIGLSNEDIARMEHARDKSPANPVSFE